MPANPQLEIVLSEALWKSLDRRARELGVPLELLAASLVRDAIQPPEGSPPRECRARTESHNPVWAVRH
ncbi:hypothetical protein OJF2_28250 [Aquisphaera giovannonii]|uniref:Ribbon-helix-helix domain-containing protein n=1 Tax=Aquisphaera giovannonii TaxID=406548 RepID=A0A5B9W2V6_9BACT|nr:hypothetical protein [Aquisphaera giovannonii]QEH34290.1 hypothetical protein OJF2_28250 [Aquisphaera giovannonii]